MVAPVRADTTSRSTALPAAAGELIPLPARRYVLRVQVDGAEYIYDATAKLPAWQADVLAALRGHNAPSGGGAAFIALDGVLRTAARMAVPLLVRLVASLRRQPTLATLVPELPKLPKHQDAMEHLAVWMVQAAFTTLGTGTFVLEPDEDAAYLDRRRDLIVQPITRLRWMVPGTVDAQQGQHAQNGLVARQDGQEGAQEAEADG